MKKAILALAFVLLCVSIANAQVTIIGPNSKLGWSDANTPVATAQTLIVNATVDAAATPIILSPIICVVNITVATTSDCSSPISQIPMGSHTVVLNNVSGTLVSLPSAPFSFVTMLIPVPSGIKLIAKSGHFWNRHYILS